MVNAWSLAASVLNGTLDEDYPIMTDDEKAVAAAKKKFPDKSDAYFEWDRNGLTENPFKELLEEDITIDTSTLASGPVSIPAPESNDEIHLSTGLTGGMGQDTITFNTGAGNTASASDGLNLNLDDDLFASMDSAGMDSVHIPLGVGYTGTEELTIKIPDDYYASAVDFQMDNTMPSAFSTLSDNDDSIAHHINTSIPSGLEDNTIRKYKEDESIKALQDYISTTYGGHYTSKENNVQTLDLIESVGDAESFCRSNAIKYLSRYDKKGQAKRDILKALHYTLLLYHFSGQLKETQTRGYETF